MEEVNWRDYGCVGFPLVHGLEDGVLVVSILSPSNLSAQISA